MSDTPSTPPPPPPPHQYRPPPPEQRSGCLTALMVVVGAILLLPGLCALLFGGIALTDPRNFDSGFVPLIVFGLLAGAFGIALIRAATRGPRT